MPTFTTTDIGNWADGVTVASSHPEGARERYLDLLCSKGRAAAKAAGLHAASDDLALLVHRLVWSFTPDTEDDDVCLLAGEISDSVSDHDAALLVEIEPDLTPTAPVGDMDENVTALHEYLLTVAHSYYDRHYGDEA